jgi:hypothetical protein
MHQPLCPYSLTEWPAINISFVVSGRSGEGQRLMAVLASSSQALPGGRSP